MRDTAYLLRFWGRDATAFYEAEKGEFLADGNCAIEGEDEAYCFWFNSKAGRAHYVRKLDGTPGTTRPCIVYSLHSGPDVREQTFADVVYRVPGKRGKPPTDYSFKIPYGYGFPADSVDFILHEGNGSCDCNRIGDIERYGNPGPEFNMPLRCGNKIELVNLKIINGNAVRDDHPDNENREKVYIEFTGTIKNDKPRSFGRVDA